jgi:hypothetical protein
MASIDSQIVIFPRFTSLAGTGSFASAPIDVSGYGGLQLQVWFGEFINASGESHFKVHLEESLDAIVWPDEARFTLDLDVSKTYATTFLSFGFRLRWFRVRVEITGSPDLMATCWVEGILRAGGGGGRKWVIEAAPTTPSKFTLGQQPSPALPGRAAGSVT